MDNNLMKLEKLIEKLDRIDGIEFPISDQELCERYENLYTGAVNDVLREATLMDQARRHYPHRGTRRTYAPADSSGGWLPHGSSASC